MSIGPRHRQNASFGAQCVAVWACAFGLLNSTSARDFGYPQVQRINERIEAGWRDSKLSASPAATDEEYCRRVFLDLIGRIPSSAEVNAYLRDRSPDRPVRLVNRLMNDEIYATEFARHWSTVWTNLLIGRTGGEERNSRVNREGMFAYLQDCFANNTSYDRMVHELISATGSNRPGEEQFNGAVNFLAGKLEENATQATAQTARIFLGMQVQCTQCHNHPFNEWKQNQFWQLNAFFRQTAALRRFEPGTRDVAYVELADEDFGGEDRPIDPREARIYYELRNGKLEAAFPVFVDGQTIPVSGLVREVNRRSELADLVVRSDDMSRAIVNRMWAHFLGYGFTKPVDDMGPHNPPFDAQLLDDLATAFREQSHDLRQLMTWIVLSRPYSLSSRANRNNQVDYPAMGATPRFSRFYVRQMTAEQLYESLLVATHADKTRADSDQQQQARGEWLQQFSMAFGTDEGDETTTFDGTITQTLMMFNGGLMEQAIRLEGNNFLSQVVAQTNSNYITKARQLFVAALSRQPTRAEHRVAEQLIASHQGDEAKALQDLWWALLNSNEFILVH